MMHLQYRIEWWDGQVVVQRGVEHVGSGARLARRLRRRNAVGARLCFRQVDLRGCPIGGWQARPLAANVKST